MKLIPTGMSLGTRERKVFRATKDIKGRQVHKALKVFKVRKVSKELQVLKG
jgi:hypothetical protein